MRVDWYSETQKVKIAVVSVSGGLGSRRLIWGSFLQSSLLAFFSTIDMISLNAFLMFEAALAITADIYCP
jgi:hypothetical protein